MLATYRHRNRLLNICGRPDDIEDARTPSSFDIFLRSMATRAEG